MLADGIAARRHARSRRCWKRWRSVGSRSTARRCCSRRRSRRPGHAEPIELEGTFPLPEAQLDRFLLRLRMGYPDEAEEDAIIQRLEADPLAALQPVVESRELVRLSRALEGVHCEASVRGYVERR